MPRQCPEFENCYYFMEYVFSHYVLILIIFQEYVLAWYKNDVNKQIVWLISHCVPTLCPECTAKYKM